MSWRRWAALCAVALVATGGGAYFWNARGPHDGCADAVPEMDESDLDIPRFYPSDQLTADENPELENWPPDIEEGVRALLEAGSPLGEPDAVVLLSPRQTYSSTSSSFSLTLIGGDVLVKHEVDPPDESDDQRRFPAVTMHDAPEGTSRWARQWKDGDGFELVGDSLVQLQNEGLFGASSVVAVDPASGEVRSCTQLDDGTLEEGIFAPAGEMVMAVLPDRRETPPTLYAVDPETGEVGWEQALEQMTGPVRSLRANDETVVFSGVDNNISVRRLTAADDLKEREAAGRVAVHAVAAGDGAARWSYAARVPDDARPFVHAVVGVTDDVAVVAADRSGDFPEVESVIQTRLVALNIATGEEVWSADLSANAWRPAIIQLFGDVVVAEELAGEDTLDLVGRAAATGAELWRLPDFHSDTQFSLDTAAAVDDLLFVSTFDGLEIVDMRTGETSTALEGFPALAIEAEGTTIGVQVGILPRLYALLLYNVG